VTLVIPIWHSLAGGALIGAGAAVLLLGNGRVAGISGIASKVLLGSPGEQIWRVAFLAGLVLPALIASAPTTAAVSGSPVLLASAGILVGYGTRTASGCTSGHGVCGISNLSARSLIATVTFLAAAMLTVALSRAVASS